MTFLNAALLFGLLALAVPPIIHLLNRRRFDVVDWAAMQFLKISRRTRQKVVFEQFMLMLTRMALIAVLVMAAAAPVIDLGCMSRLPGGQRLARLAGHADRDIVFIVDGSYSMDYRRQHLTADQSAREWLGKFLDDLFPGDRVAVLQAKQRSVSVVGMLTSSAEEVRTKVEAMPKPRGNVDWSKSMLEAFRVLQAGANPEKEIIILTDGQRHGWADPKSLENWELLVQTLPQGMAMPRVWVVNVTPDTGPAAPNWFIAPITSNRTVATLGREVKFKFDLHLSQDDRREENEEASAAQELPAPPPKVNFEVDGQPAGQKSPPAARLPRLGMEFTQKFNVAGSHLVSARIGDDALLADNRRDLAIEVLPAIPVLLVDGESRSAGRPRRSEFLRLAVAPAGDSQPSFNVRTVASGDFSLQLLTNPITRDPGSIPRVVIFSNVPELTDDQQKAIEEFLNRGGGVLVTLGSRCVASSWNDRVFRDGQGWLPARLVEPKGDENAIDRAPVLVPEGLEQHPALALFKSNDKGSLKSAYFPRYWGLDTTHAGSGAAVATLTSGDPLLVEKSSGKGRTILSAVPLDNSWRTNLTDLYDFVRLSHELLYYLASARSGEFNLASGDDIVFRPGDAEPPGGLTIDAPEGPRRRVEVSSWPYSEKAIETGVYKLTTDSGRVQYYVVQPDVSESNLTLCDDKDRRAVQANFPKDRFTYENDQAGIKEAFRQSQSDPPLWGLFLLLVIVLLGAELMYTRRLARKSQANGFEPQRGDRE